MPSVQARRFGSFLGFEPVLKSIRSLRAALSRRILEYWLFFSVGAPLFPCERRARVSSLGQSRLSHLPVLLNGNTDFTASCEQRHAPCTHASEVLVYSPQMPTAPPKTCAAPVARAWRNAPEAASMSYECLAIGLILCEQRAFTATTMIMHYLLCLFLRRQRTLPPLLLLVLAHHPRFKLPFPLGAPPFHHLCTHPCQLLGCFSLRIGNLQRNDR